MIKPIAPALALIGASLLLPTAARAADYYCFMVDSNGVIRDLTEMCSPTTPATTAAPVSTVSAPASRPTLTGAALEEALFTGAVIHADAFCEARAQGGTRRESSNAATSALAGFMVSEGIPTTVLTPAFFSEAEESSRLLCPELQPTGRYD